MPTSDRMGGLVRFQVIGAAAAILFTRLVAADDWPYYQHDALHSSLAVSRTRHDFIRESAALVVFSCNPT